MSAEDSTLPPLTDSNHSEWSLRHIYDRLNNDHNSLKRHHMDLKNSHDKSLRELKTIRESYHLAQQQISRLKDELNSLKAHAIKLEEENIIYKQLRDDQYENNDTMSILYDKAMDRNSTLKQDLEQSKNDFHCLQEEFQKYKKMYENECEEHKQIVKEVNTLRYQCTTTVQSWQSARSENLKLQSKIDKLQHDIELMKKEKELMKKMAEQEKREKDEVAKDYELVMKERDKVLSELQSYSDRLTETHYKAGEHELEKKQLNDMILIYRQETNAALYDRDQAQKRLREINDCIHKILQEPNANDLRDRLIDVTKCDRHEVNEERSIREFRLSVQDYDLKDSNTDAITTSKEVELLKRDMASLRKELNEAKAEASISIKRRDWAFSERDKIVQERESIRRQCDELRRERDRAISNNIEVLKELEELKKFKNNTSRELKEVRERLEKEERKSQLIGQSSSRDSAIDNDFQDWDTETLEYEIAVSNEDLGIDLKSGDSSDPSVYVSNILKGSPCEGKLRVNDVLLKVNDVDISNGSKKTVFEAINAASNSVFLRVLRKKPVGRFNITVELNLNKKELGLQLENGVYVSKIIPGSALAREGTIAVGDRVLAVNDKPIEHRSAKEVIKLIESFGDYVSLSVGKYGALPGENQNHSTTETLSNVYNTRSKIKTRSSVSERNLDKHPADDGTGTSRKRSNNIYTFFNNLIFKKEKANGDENDDSATLKCRTDEVWQMFDEIYTKHDSGTWPSRIEGLDISSNGTVTVRPKPSTKKAIPENLIDPRDVYRHSSLEHSNSKPDESYNVSSISPNDRVPRVMSPYYKPILYEPKVHTLPTNNSRRLQPSEVYEKSKSLEGHTSRNSHTPNGNQTPGNSAHSLDKAVQEMIKHREEADKRDMRRNRPTSLTPHSVAARAMSPNDLYRNAPPSPHRKNRSFTPENVSGNRSHSTSANHSTLPSVSSNNSIRSNCNSQVFFPHAMFPSYSPPPPYDKMYSPSISSYGEEAQSARHDSSSSSAFYNVHRDGSKHSQTAQPYQSMTLDRKMTSNSSGIHHATPVRPSSSTDYSTARLKFPSSHSVSSSNKKSVNSSSLEIASSDRGSPVSSHFITESYGHHSEEYISDSKLRKLKEGVLREIILDTSNKHLGINIEETPGTGIFVTSVSHNSLAAEVGIEVGDQIIEFCGINMRTATYSSAASVLQSWQSGEGKVKMKVQYNPKRCKYFPEQVNDVDKNSVTGSIQAINAYADMMSYHKRLLFGSSIDQARLDPPRTVYVQRKSQHIGLRLRGGNATGVFVAEISPNSPFVDTDLKVGDQILEINGRRVAGAIAEQVSTELHRPSETMNLLVQYNISRYSTIVKGGDHFYVRAHFNHRPDNDTELSINNGDLLLVEDSLVDGQIGLWYVWKIDERENLLQGGIVPSRIRFEESFSLKRSYSDVMPDEDGKSGRRNGSIGRRSFFKRRSSRHQHQRSGSKDSRELTSFSDLSTSSDNVPTADDGIPLLYQRVERVECIMPRPVVILGPFAQAIIQKLVSESPDKYFEYKEECLNASDAVIDKGITDGVFVDYKRANDLFNVTRTQTLFDIAASKHHALLMVHPSAIERMHRCKLYPIVIYIQHKSLKQIKEVKDPRFLPERLSSRSAKELFEYFQKIGTDYSNCFTVVIQGSNMASMSQSIKKAVDEEQTKKIWI